MARSSSLISSSPTRPPPPLLPRRPCCPISSCTSTEKNRGQKKAQEAAVGGPPGPGERRGALFLFSLAVVSLSSGLVYGWPALRRNLVSSSEEGGSSSITEEGLGLIFTVGSWSTQGGRFLFGLARDRYLGTRLTAAMSLILTATGCFGIALSDANDVVALSVSMFAVGLGSGAQICVQPVAVLYPPRYQGTVLASLSGAFQVAGLVFLALTTISNDRSKTFFPFALLLVLMAIAAVKLLPRRQFIRKLEKTKATRNLVVDLPTEEDEGGKEDGNINNKDGSDRQESASAKEEEEEAACGAEEHNPPATSDDEPLTEKGSEDDDDDVEAGIVRGRHGIDEEFEAPWADEPELPVATTKNAEDDCIEHNKAFEVRTPCNPVITNDKDNDDDDDCWTDNPPVVAESADDSNGKCTDDEAKARRDDERSLKELMRTPEYLLLVLWFSVQVVPLQYYVASVGFQLERRGDSDGKYTALFSILYTSAAALAPMLGKIADAAGLGTAQALATSLSAASLFVLASDSIPLDAHAAGMASYGAGRMMIFGAFFANVGKRFGYTHYGMLAGSGLIISAVISLMQYPLIAAAAGGSEREVNVWCGCVMLCTGLPYCFWLGRRERLK